MTVNAAVDAEPGRRLGARLRGFGPVGIVSMILIVLAGNIIGAALTLVWAWLSRTPWRELGFVRSRNWARDIALGVTAGILLKLLMKLLIESFNIVGLCT